MQTVTLDIETTDLPKTDRRGNADWSGVHVAQVAVAIRGPEGMDESLWLVRLPEGAAMSDGARRVNGLTPERLVAEGSSFAHVWAAVRDRLAGNIVVGQNLLAFDLPCLVAQAERESQPTTIRPAAIVDTKLAWEGYLHGMRRGPGESIDHFHGRLNGKRLDGQSNLAFLAELFESRDVPTHDALRDALATEQVYLTMLRRGIIRKVYGREVERLFFLALPSTSLVTTTAERGGQS